MALVKVPAADAALRLLTYLASQQAPVPAARVAQELQLPRSRTYDLLSTLARHGYVLHLEQERLYGLRPVPARTVAPRAGATVRAGTGRLRALRRLSAPGAAGADREAGHRAPGRRDRRVRASGRAARP